VSTFTLSRTVTQTFTEGWGVACIPIHDGDNEGISELEVVVVRIARERCRIIGGVWCVKEDFGPDNGPWFPVENFKVHKRLTADDTHDLRDHFFEVETEAREHAAWVQNRWEHPQPWESFIELGG
jgi:hypothetical protein